MKTHTALVMAGGTGGHIFPGLAVAEALRTRGWQVHWLGAPGSMESRLVPPRDPAERIAHQRQELHSCLHPAKTKILNQAHDDRQSH